MAIFLNPAWRPPPFSEHMFIPAVSIVKLNDLNVTVCIIVNTFFGDFDVANFYAT